MICVNMLHNYSIVMIFWSHYHTYADNCINKIKESMGINYWWYNFFGITDMIYFDLSRITHFSLRNLGSFKSKWKGTGDHSDISQVNGSASQSNNTTISLTIEVSCVWKEFFLNLAIGTYQPIKINYFGVTEYQN